MALLLRPTEVDGHVLHHFQASGRVFSIKNINAMPIRTMRPVLMGRVSVHSDQMWIHRKRTLENDMNIGSAVAKVAKLTCKCHLSRSIFGFISSKFILGAMWLYFKEKAMFMIAARPLTAPVWPMLVLTEPTAVI